MIKCVRQSLKGVMLAGVPAAFAPFAAQAALPVFDSWTVSGGTISVACPTGFTCETVSTGDGFAQLQWTDSSGNTYIQTVITEQGAGTTDPNTGQGTAPAALPYSDESFVQLGNVDGISSKQHYLEQKANGDNFENTSQIKTGWANPAPDATNPNLDVSQTFNTQGGAASGDEFSSTFQVKIIHDATGAVQDRNMTIDQQAGLGDGATASTDVQRYVLVQKQGAFTATAGDLTLDPTSFDANNAPLNGGTVNWVAGDDVMLRWIGQRVSVGTQGTALFGFEGVTNLASTSGQTEATTFSTTSAGIVPDTTDPQGYATPFDWDATFGATPPSLP